MTQSNLTNRARAHAALKQQMTDQQEASQRRLARRLAVIRQARAARRNEQQVEVDGRDITPYVRGPVTAQVNRTARPAAPQRRPVPRRLQPDQTANQELQRRIALLRRKAAVARQKVAEHRQPQEQPAQSPRFAALRARLAARRRQQVEQRTAEVPQVIRTKDGHTWQLID
jgi:hypothetical protein